MSIISNLSGDGCNTQEKWKKKGYEKNLGGKLGALWEMWRIDILVVSASQDAGGYVISRQK